MSRISGRCFYQYLNAFLVLVIVLTISSMVAFHFSEVKDVVKVKPSVEEVDLEPSGQDDHVEVELSVEDYEGVIERTESLNMSDIDGNKKIKFELKK